MTDSKRIFVHGLHALDAGRDDVGVSYRSRRLGGGCVARVDAPDEAAPAKAPTRD